MYNMLENALSSVESTASHEEREGFESANGQLLFILTVDCGEYRWTIGAEKY